MLQGSNRMATSTSITFTGDIAFSKYFSNSWKGNGCISNELSSYLHSSDYVIANIESPVTHNNVTVRRKLVHSSPFESAQYLSRNNIRYWNIANNHITDCGAEGIKDTVTSATQNNCITIGAGITQYECNNPTILGNNVKIGIVSLAKPWTQLKSNNNACLLFMVAKNLAIFPFHM